MARTSDIHLPDLTGTLAVVTGASDGIGLVIATRLAQRGAEVIMPVRTPAKGETAAERVRGAAPGATVSTRALDLSSLESVAALADGLRSEGRPITLLVNNAGVMQPPQRQVTRENFELQFGTNHLGHFALTLGLLPLLREGRARVTHQTSVAARSGAINWDDLNWQTSYDAMKAYTQSKIAVGLFARELDSRSRAAGWGISSNLSHPGISPTNLLAAQATLGRQKDTGGRRMVSVLSRLGIAGTVASAAQPALLAAVSSKSRGYQFFGPVRVIGGRAAVAEMWAPMRNMGDARRMWDESERLTGMRLQPAS
jgi:NAD(P)-dependent dehydrogenase (short-subunit alcohol dehydrogenase family)